MHTHTGACMARNRVLDPLALELQVAVSIPVRVLGTGHRLSEGAKQALSVTVTMFPPKLCNSYRSLNLNQIQVAYLQSLQKLSELQETG